MSKARHIARGKKKSDAYEVLLTKYREKFPHAGREDIKNKIHSPRTNFKKEQQRPLNSKKSGAGSEDKFTSRELVLRPATGLTITRHVSRTI
jgi:hypothetical protein